LEVEEAFRAPCWPSSSIRNATLKAASRRSSCSRSQARVVRA